MVLAALYAGMTTTTDGVRVPRNCGASCVVPTVTTGTPWGIERGYRSEPAAARLPNGAERSPVGSGRLDHGQRGQHAIPCRQDGFRVRPLDADGGIVPGDATLRGRVVIRGHLVADVGHLAGDEEAVRESDRHVELMVAHIVELERLVA